MVQSKSRKYGEDLAKCEQELATSLNENGAESPKTLSLLCRKALCCKHLNLLDEAERLYLDCLEKRKRVLGLEHVDTLKVMGLLALLYEQQPRWHSKALEMYGEALSVRTLALGELHSDTILVSRNRGHFLYKISRHREAVDAYVLYFRKVRAVKGSFHPTTIMALLCIYTARFFSKLPMNHRIKGEYKKAFLLLVGSVLFSMLRFFVQDVLGLSFGGATKEITSLT